MVKKHKKKPLRVVRLHVSLFSFLSLAVLKKIILIKTLSVRLNVASMEISLHSKSGMYSSRISQKLWGRVIKWSFIWDYCSSCLAFFLRFVHCLRVSSNSCQILKAVGHMYPGKFICFEYLAKLRSKTESIFIKLNPFKTEAVII